MEPQSPYRKTNLVFQLVKGMKERKEGWSTVLEKKKLKVMKTKKCGSPVLVWTALKYDNWEILNVYLVMIQILLDAMMASWKTRKQSYLRSMKE
jgi:hypothetical protein